jgi:hypothetical protein
MSKPFQRSVHPPAARREKEKYRATYTLPELRQRLQAAEAQTHPAPSEAQKQAGNYPKGLFRFRGLEVSIENPAGSVRAGKDRDGREWAVTMPYAYGYLRRTLARDGDQIDVFLGPHLDSDVVFGVDQVDPRTGAYDETKWFLGWKSKDAAKQAYTDSYAPGWQGFLAITAMTFAQFKRWLEHGDAARPIGPQVTEKYSRGHGDKRIPNAYRDTLSTAQWAAACQIVSPALLADLKRQIGRLALGSPEVKQEGPAGTVEIGGRFAQAEVWIKDFDPIKIEIDPDAVEGVNCFRDAAFVPRPQVWLDWDLGAKDRKPVALHEIVESILMAHDWKYDPAHQAANRFEVAWRRELGVGLERYARPWSQIKAAHLAKQAQPAPAGDKTWTEEDERKHPRDKGKFAPKPGAEAAPEPAAAQSPAGQQEPASQVSIGGRAFEVLQRGKDWLFRFANSAKAPWSKATAAAAAAIERLAEARQARQLQARHQQAKWGDVPVARRAHRKAKGLVGRLVRQILRSMAAQEQRPDPAEAARERAWRERLNHHAVQLLRQTGQAYRQARQERDATAAALKRTPKYLEEVQDPETGEILPRHVLELRQKHARAVARVKLAQQKQKWKEERSKEWQKEQQRRREERERQFARQANARAQRELQRRQKAAAAEAKAEQEKARRLQADNLKAQMQAFYDANKRPELTPQERAEKDRRDEERRKASAIADAEAEGRRKAENVAARQGRLEEKRAALRDAALAEGIDPQHLQAAAEHLAELKQPEAREYNEALDHAVARSGLTPARIHKLEDSGQDYTSVPGFDLLTSDMASDYPILGMGGRAGEAGNGDPEALWELLKQGKRRVPQYYDEDIVREALPMAASGQRELAAAAAGGEEPWMTEEFQRGGLKEFYGRGFFQRSTGGNRA